ncbi:MAG: efflux RND transporter permease subunit, partial [Myxococcota bacterium]
ALARLPGAGSPVGARLVAALPLAALAVVVGVLLADDWRPLGAGRGLIASGLAVAAVVAAVVGGFAALRRIYEPVLRWCLAHRALFLLVPGAVVLLGLLAWLGAARLFGWAPEVVRDSRPVATAEALWPGLGREFMPPLDEGSFLVMPVTMPHASLGQALELLQAMDVRLAAVPEVDRVIGKLGRVASALDPAPVSMFETVVTYKPEYRVAADGTRVRQWRDHIRSADDIWAELARAAAGPGLTPVSKLMPIETRRLMLQTGMRGTLGLRVRAPDLAVLDRANRMLEAALRDLSAVDGATVTAEQVVGKPYVEIVIDRQAIARHGLAVADVQDVLSIALGGV